MGKQYSEQELKIALLKQRISISDKIKRQRENYKVNKLFSVDYQEGMSDAALIAYDPDKHDEANLESWLATQPKSLNKESDK